MWNLMKVKYTEKNVSLTFDNFSLMHYLELSIYKEKINYFKSLEKEVGSSVKEGFEYNSFNNHNYLQKQKLNKLIEGIRVNTN